MGSGTGLAPLQWQTITEQIMTIFQWGHRGPFYQNGLTFIPAGISNHMPRIVCSGEVWECIRIFIPNLYDGCNRLSMLGLKLIYVSKRVLRNKLKWNFNHDKIIFRRNSFENIVCEMLAILFGPQCLNNVQFKSGWFLTMATRDVTVYEYSPYMASKFPCLKH